jgi:hypothetical protein
MNSCFQLPMPARRTAKLWLLVVLVALGPNARAQNVRVESQVEVSPPEGGWYPWYEVHADPGNAGNLIVCGGVASGDRNTLYGFVYSSSDGGKTWRRSFEDKSSRWVSEQSCAFGLKGRAYFVSEATKVIDGVRHTELGTTRIFVSDDAGRTWTYRTATGWADYSASIVDTTLGPTQNRLYIFFNSPLTTSAGDGREGTRIGVLGFGARDRRVQEPFFNVGMESYGSFPERAFMLKDGSAVSLYWGGLKTENGQEVLLGAVRMNKGGKSISDPVIIAHTPVSTDINCYGYAEAYDASREEIHAAYHELREGKCRFQLRSSPDGGQTWSQPTEIATQDGAGHSFDAPAMAANRYGVLGLIWRDRRDSDCWYFSVSSPPGKTFSIPQPLSACGVSDDVASTISSAFLMSEVAGSDLRVANMRGEVWRNAGSLTASADGVFHAVWAESGEGKGQLRTASVEVSGSDEGRLVPLPPDLATHEITRTVALLFGGMQHYDFSSERLTLDVALRNKGDKPIQAPVFLKALTLDGDVGKVEIVNADNGASGPGAIWDVSRAMGNGVLPPGSTTQAYRLAFRITPGNKNLDSKVGVVSMKVSVLSP